MKLAIPKGNGEFFTFTNEDLKIGDKVFPLLDGWSHGGKWYMTGLSFKHDLDHDAFSIFACTGWRRNEKRREPHTIMDFYVEDGLRRIRTDKGYSPAEVYFKFTGIESMAGTEAGPCSECGVEATCKLKQNRKGGCSFYWKRKT